MEVFIDLLEVLLVADCTPLFILFRKYQYRGADKSFCPIQLKKQLKGRHFSSDLEVIAAAETWLDGQLSHFFFEWLA